MSDTPRTDAATDFTAPEKLHRLCKELETELANAKKNEEASASLTRIVSDQRDKHYAELSAEREKVAELQNQLQAESWRADAERERNAELELDKKQAALNSLHWQSECTKMERLVENKEDAACDLKHELAAVNETLRKIREELDQWREVAETLACFVEPEIWADQAAYDALEAYESLKEEAAK